MTIFLADIIFRQLYSAKYTTYIYFSITKLRFFSYGNIFEPQIEKLLSLTVITKLKKHQYFLQLSFQITKISTSRDQKTVIGRPTTEFRN